MSKDLKEVNEQAMPGAFQTGNSKRKALRLELLKAGEEGPVCGVEQERQWGKSWRQKGQRFVAVGLLIRPYCLFRD